MAKRARRELARLNEQTQFSLVWPDIPESQEAALLNAVQELAAQCSATSGNERQLEERSDWLVLGVNKLTQIMQDTISERGKAGQAMPSHEGDDANRKVKLILIARHARQIFVQHLPFLALQAGQKTSKKVKTSISTASHSASSMARMVKICGLPLTSAKLGEMFGIRSAAAVGIRADHPNTKEVAAVFAAAKNEHALNPSCFKNIDARVLLG